MRQKDTHIQRMQDSGWHRTTTGERLSGDYLLYLRTDTALDIYRQRDGATKHQDLGDGYPALPEQSPRATRQWALTLAQDDLTDWQPDTGGYCFLCRITHAPPRPIDAPQRPRGRPRRALPPTV